MANAYKILHLPSEVYKDGQSPVKQNTLKGAFVDKVIKSEYGLLTYFREGKFPMKGLLDDIVMGDVDSVKKHLKVWFKFFGFFPQIVFAIPLFFSNKAIKKWIELTADVCKYHLNPHFLLSEHYSIPGREILRVGNKHFNSEIGNLLTESFVRIFETDLPYKYRVMDILQCLDLASLEQNPLKEIRRLFNILGERDKQRDWKEIGRAVSVLLWFRRDIRKKVVEVLRDLNPKSFWFDEADLYFFLINSPSQNDPAEYNVLGMTREERERIWKQIDAGEKNLKV